VTPIEIQWLIDPEQDHPPGRRSPEKANVSEDNRAFFISILTRLRHDEVINDIIIDLRTRRSLQMLVPFFIRYLTDSIKVNLRQPSFVFRLLRVAHSIFVNDDLDHNDTFHHFLSMALTAVVTPLILDQTGDVQFELRSEAAGFVAKIVERFTPVYTTLRGSIVDRYAHILYHDESPARVKYGAIRGLMAIGGQCCRDVMIPKLEELLSQTRLMTDSPQPFTIETQIRSEKCHLEKAIEDCCLLVMELNETENTKNSLKMNDEIRELLNRRTHS
jgi:hypothetical protein